MLRLWSASGVVFLLGVKRAGQCRDKAVFMFELMSSYPVKKIEVRNFVNYRQQILEEADYDAVENSNFEAI